MSVTHWIAGVLLAAGVGVQVVCCLGLLLAHDAYDRLHVASLAGMLGGPLVCGAVLVNESFSQGGMKAIVVGTILLGTGPVITHATGRAVHLRHAREAAETAEARRP